MAALIGTYKIAENVSQALKEALEDINAKLENAPGRISKMRVDIKTGFGGAGVKILLSLSGNDSVRKKVIGVNARGFGEEAAFRKALEDISKMLNQEDGEIADFHSEIQLSPIPGIVYSTIIVAINYE